MRSRLALVSRRVGFVGLGSMGSGSLEAKGRFGGFPKRRVYGILGSILGSLYFGKLPFRRFGVGFGVQDLRFRALA